MSDNRKLQAVDREGSKWPYWVYIPVDRSWNGPYTHLTNSSKQFLLSEELKRKKIDFQFRRQWIEERDQSSWFKTRKIVTWHRYKFKSKGDRLIFLMTHAVEKASDEYR